MWKLRPHTTTASVGERHASPVAGTIPTIGLPAVPGRHRSPAPVHHMESKSTQRARHAIAPTNTDPFRTTPGGTCTARPYVRTGALSSTMHGIDQPAMTPTAVVGAVREPPVSCAPAQFVAPCRPPPSHHDGPPLWRPRPHTTTASVGERHASPLARTIPTIGLPAVPGRHRSPAPAHHTGSKSTQRARHAIAPTNTDPFRTTPGGTCAARPYVRTGTS